MKDFLINIILIIIFILILLFSALIVSGIYLLLTPFIIYFYIKDFVNERNNPSNILQH